MTESIKPNVAKTDNFPIPKEAVDDENTGVDDDPFAAIYKAKNTKPVTEPVSSKKFKRTVGETERTPTTGLKPQPSAVPVVFKSSVDVEDDFEDPFQKPTRKNPAVVVESVSIEEDPFQKATRPRPVPIITSSTPKKSDKQPDLALESIPEEEDPFQIATKHKPVPLAVQPKPIVAADRAETLVKKPQPKPVQNPVKEPQKTVTPASKKPVPTPLPLPPSNPSLVKNADPKPKPKPVPVPVTSEAFVFGNIGNPADLPPSARTQPIPVRVPVPVPVPLPIEPELKADEMVVVEEKEKTREVSFFPITLWVVPSNTNDPDHFTRVPLAVTDGEFDETSKEIKLTLMPRQDDEDEEWLNELKTKRQFFYSNEKKTRKVWYGRDNIMNTRFDLTIEQSDGPIYDYFHTVMTSESDQPVPVSFSDLIVTQKVSVTNHKKGVQETQSYIFTFNSTEHVFDLINGETE